MIHVIFCHLSCGKKKKLENVNVFLRNVIVIMCNVRTPREGGGGGGGSHIQG